MKKLTLIILMSLSFNVLADDLAQDPAPVTEKSFMSETISTLGDPRAFATCQAADLITTKIAFSHGAVEGNPLMAHIFTKFGWVGLIGFKLVLIYGVYKIIQHYGESAKPVVAIGTVITCGVAGHNLFVN